MTRPKAKPIIGWYGTLRDAPKVSRALGEMTARWSLLEFQILNLFISLTGLDRERASAILFAVNATRGKIDIVQAVAKRLPDGDSQRSAALAALEEVVKLSNRRNSLTHHVWFCEVNAGKAYTFDYRKEQGKSRSRIYTAKAIDLFNNEIIDACRSLGAAAGVGMTGASIAAYKMKFT